MSKFSKTQVIAFSGMLIAIAAVLGFFKIPISSVLEIRLQSIPMAVGGILFGPVTGGIIGAASDIVCYLVKPTGPFFPGFTISYFLTGLIYGLMLHNKKPSLVRIIIASSLNAFLIGILLNSVWLSLLYGNGFVAVLTARVLKEVIMIPVNSAIIFAIVKALTRAGILGSVRGKRKRGRITTDDTKRTENAAISEP